MASFIPNTVSLCLKPNSHLESFLRGLGERDFVYGMIHIYKVYRPLLSSISAKLATSEIRFFLFFFSAVDGGSH
ncbi:hypothetical protein BABINDRAFT_162269 [Babjeviella inositovora NRRL Y-12698]|uniref:Uncharacterized protein n=1 Tax=Babjeviella inositovora NRRL Y-12698 TaxID=984486 RepID=A0A1E3QQ83_9ASCO|nr:uncharacterized protein BABINDRAFT_162269 [Babjeviella inositovora NRRL Y-12698]ODQ79232.1 hypothetical protein BABINDRAFT_162269 [Babjeviella inositovora NRRL Y-12698]